MADTPRPPTHTPPLPPHWLETQTVRTSSQPSRSCVADRPSTADTRSKSMSGSESERLGSHAHGDTSV